MVLVGTILFESRRPNLVPLVTDFFGNQRRTLLRLMELSERTSAAECKEVRAASQPVRDSSFLHIDAGRLLRSLVRHQ